jgi:hypothetical protein
MSEVALLEITLTEKAQQWIAEEKVKNKNVNHALVLWLDVQSGC